jgi:hypothetical protein
VFVVNSSEVSAAGVCHRSVGGVHGPCQTPEAK